MIDPRQEQEHAFTFEVTLGGYGHRDRVMLDAAAALGAALHRIDPSDGWELRVDGKRVRFDALAADGEHEGHETPLAVETDTPPATVADAPDVAPQRQRRSWRNLGANGSNLG